jgi:hypothetical protein
LPVLKHSGLFRVVFPKTQSMAEVGCERNMAAECGCPESLGVDTFTLQTTNFEDSLGTRYTQIGTVTLTWFGAGKATTFLVECAVVEDDLDVMILGRPTCWGRPVPYQMILCATSLGRCSWSVTSKGLAAGMLCLGRASAGVLCCLWPSPVWRWMVAAPGSWFLVHGRRR